MVERAFDRSTWQARVAEWWRKAAGDLPGTMKRLGATTAYGLLTASAWLPLLEAYGQNPGPAVAALAALVSGVGTNLLSNLVQGAYDQATASHKTEQEVQDNEGLRAEHRQVVEQLDVLASAQAALGAEWSDLYQQLLREDRQLGGALHIEIAGDLIAGDKVGRDKIEGDQINLFIEKLPRSAAGILGALQRPADADELRRAMEEYLHCLLDRHFYLSLKGLGVSDRVPLRLPLLDLYVPLQARVQLPEGETWRREMAVDADLRLAGRELVGRLSELRPVLDLLNENDGLIILGDPGAGKTTFLKYLALQLALGQGDGVGLNHRLPVLLPLSAYANALNEDDVRLDEFIATYLHEMGADLPVADLLRDALRQGRALILFDGLDEVQQARLRHLVVERVVDFYTFHHHAGNKFVLTSRVVGYREVRPVAEGLAECTLVDFDDNEIAAFVERWTMTLERQARLPSRQGESRAAAQDAERERRDLLHAVQHNAGVRRLAANPLLLTILALMKRQGVTLPERRVELYDQYVKTLLSSWNRARGLGRPPTRDLDVVGTVRVLAPLALWMHQVNPGVGLVRRGDLERELVRIYQERGLAEAEAAARQFLSDVREHAGLLLERGPGQYGFIHLTFEEYLAAVGVARLGQREIDPLVELLAAHVGDPAWQEVSLLAVGYLGIVQQWEQVASDVVDGLIARWPGEPGEAAALAGEAVLDAWPGGVTAACRERVQAALIETMQSADVAPKLRRQAGLVLGRLGWQPDDLDVFVEIPAGPFLYGDDKKRRTIAQRYWIGRYPVTNGQYARFVRDRGYERREFWSEEGWAWRSGTYDSKAEGDLKDYLAQRPAEKRDQPFWWDDLERGNPIFPVVGVCWFEAEAYCNWLTEQLKAGPQPAITLPDGYAARLPMEEEWERAIRGANGHEYPWGNEILLHQINFADAWAGKLFKDTNEWIEWTRNIPIFVGTTAVCTYPQGANAAGVWDGTGNVWEWTASWYDRRRDSRVLRGGSWFGTSGDARCANRVRYPPDGWDDFSGFRVSVFLAFSGS